jgi:hypothetical protein
MLRLMAIWAAAATFLLASCDSGAEDEQEQQKDAEVSNDIDSLDRDGGRSAADVDASSGGLVGCPANLLDCDGECIDPKTNRDYCGALNTCTGDNAGAVCAAGELCQKGTCQLSCQKGLVNCEGKCVDPISDPRYCGADESCAKATSCAAGMVCSNGACLPSCQIGLVNCDGKCVNPLENAHFCGVDEACSGGTECGAGSVCVQGVCQALGFGCSDGKVLCANRCIDPNTDPLFCGASGSCTNERAGKACLTGQSCKAAACVCPDGTIPCGSRCVDPLLDRDHCGASGTCGDANTGAACTAVQTCIDGHCVARPDIDWHPVYSVAPPAFKKGTTTVAHIVFDATNMTDTTGNTHWAKTGTPGVAQTGMWTPPQAYSGPFSATAFWQADKASKTWLDTHTNSDFLVCARYKPGRYPGRSANKVIIANGYPEATSSDPQGTAHGGWSLVQTGESFGFRYHDAAANGEWMASASPSYLDREALVSMEWTWHCGGRAGAIINGVWESFDGQMTATGGQPSTATLGAYQASSDTQLPTIGAYADGSRPLFDGGVYEIIIKSESGTPRNMWRTIAEASGGLRWHNVSPIPVQGADRLTHWGAPSTVLVEPGDYIMGDQRVWMSDVLKSNPTTAGECFGFMASSTDWSSLEAYAHPLAWNFGESRSEIFWPVPTTYHCVASYDLVGGTSIDACGSPAEMAAGSRVAFMGCFDPRDSRVHLYQNGAEIGVSTGTLTPGLYPRLDDVNSWFGTAVDGNDRNLRIHRVFACGTADPASCH